MMSSFIRCTGAATLLSLAISFGVPLVSSGAPITVPNGLHPGDQYRLVFFTEPTRDSTSANIADYNAFVTADANTIAALVALGTTWKAIGSTASVDAEDNTATNPGISQGVPIYNLGGQLVVANNSGLWSGTLVHEISFNEAGHAPGHNFAWTGTTVSGHGAVPFQLGTNVTEEGDLANTDFNWIATGASNSSIQNSFYAISGTLTVPVPEPSTWLLFGSGAVGLLACHRRVRRRYKDRLCLGFPS
jgi:hypothetical protein